MKITDDQGYLKPKEVESFYKLCPAPRPVNNEMTKSCPTPIVTPSSDCGSSLYLAMDRAPTAFSREDLHKTMEEFSCQPIKEEEKQCSRSESPSSRKPNKMQPVVEDKYQRELAEIIMDFKNNVHSLSQVRNLNFPKILQRFQKESRM